MATRTIPAAAFFSAAGPMEIGDNGEGAKSAPFKALARSAEPMDHWFFGRLVHDLSGMMSKPRIAIDYCHDPNQIIGYGNKFSVGVAGLEVGGALTPYGECDRAAEIVAKSKAGVPYEASIDWRGTVVLEDVPAGMTCQVNGRQMAGPLTVVRQWTLSGLAICPHGMDPNTQAQFAAQGDITVTVLPHEEPKMADETKPAAEAAAAQAAAVDATPVQIAAEATVVQASSLQEGRQDACPTSTAAVDAAHLATEAAPAAAVDAALAAAPPEPPGRRFLAAFGDLGGRWFAEGLSFDEAQTHFAAHQADRIAAQATEIAELKLRLSQVPRGDKPVTFQAAQPDLPPDPNGERRAARLAELTNKLGSPALAAAALKFEENPVGPQH